jgi:hypothetical protein
MKQQNEHYETVARGQTKRTPGHRAGLTCESVSRQSRARRISCAVQDQEEQERDNKYLTISDEMPVGDADDLHRAHIPEAPQTEVLDNDASIGDDKSHNKEPHLKVALDTVRDSSTSRRNRIDRVRELKGNATRMDSVLEEWAGK